MPIPRHHPTRRSALCMIGATLALGQSARAASPTALAGQAFGTRWRITGPDVDSIPRLQHEIEMLFSRIDRQFSPWRTDSVISQFNALPAGDHLVDRDLTHVTAAALDLARRSEGAFDPTVGPLVARWGFGPIQMGGTPDWRGLGTAHGQLAKNRDDLTLDLCGIAKGWALDEAAAMVRAHGLGDFLFEIGGEFISQGTHPNGRDWRVAVEAPLPGQPPEAALRLPPGAAVATSGTRAQSYELKGQLYSHIIDPRRHAPVPGGYRSVTVVAEDTMTADGWATALCAAGDVAGPDLARTNDIAALFLIRDGEVTRRIQTGPITRLML